MRLILIAIALVATITTGCTSKSPACGIAKTISTHVADEISTQLACTNKDAIKAHLDAQLEKIKVCEQMVSTQSIIGDVVCGPLVDGLLNGALSKVPAEWGCQGGPLGENLKDQLLTACKKAL